MLVAPPAHLATTADRVAIVPGVAAAMVAAWPGLAALKATRLRRAGFVSAGARHVVHALALDVQHQ